MGPSLLLRASSSEPPLRAQLKRRQPSRVASRRITGQLGEQQCTLQRRCLSRRPVSPRCLSPQARAVRRLPRRHQACIGCAAACRGCHRASASLAAPPPFSTAPSTAPRQRRCTLGMAMWGWRMCMCMHAAAPALPPPHPLPRPCRPCCAPVHLPVLPPSTWHPTSLSLIASRRQLTRRGRGGSGPAAREGRGGGAGGGRRRGVAGAAGGGGALSTRPALASVLHACV